MNDPCCFRVLLKSLLLWAILIAMAPVGFARGSEAVLGIWTSPQELAAKPMSGPAWEAVLAGAQRSISDTDLSDQDNHTGVFVLARAILFGRAPQQFPDYDNAAIAAIEELVARGNPGGRTLAWGRNITAYVLAADLIGYRTAAFEQYLADLADKWECSQITSPYRRGRKATLREMFEKRPNNWGAHAFAALAAIYRYLGKTDDLAAIRAYWIQAVTGPKPPGLDYGGDNSKGWHVVEDDPRWINPHGAGKCGIDLDGIIPDDMDRGAAFSCDRDEKDFTYTGYAWEGLQGLIVAARILERAGMPIWDAGDQALFRAAYALQVRLGSLNSRWQATSNNSGWLLVFLDAAYGTDWAKSLDSKPKVKWGYGRGAGWGYVLNFDSGGTRSDSAAVYGVVRDSLSLAALAGAQVQLLQNGQVRYQATSAASGAFVLLQVQPGAYTLACSKSGYRSWQGALALQAEEQRTGLTISLVPEQPEPAPEPQDEKPQPPTQVRLSVMRRN